MRDETLTFVEVAALFKVADKAVYAMAQERELTACMVLGPWRFRRADIDVCLASRIPRTTTGTRRLADLRGP